MSRKEECLDNAVAESFFGTLKMNRCAMRMTERATKPAKACLDTSRFSTIGGDAKRISATWPLEL
jgi:hypothetical protein